MSATTRVSAPAAPSLTARATSSSQISLTWNNVAGATGYLIDEWVNGAWKQIANFGSGTTSYTVSGLSANSTHYFIAAAYNSAGTTWSSNYVSATTTAGVTIDHPLASATYTVVNGSLFGPNGPVYTDVHQGAVGDCWLLASLAEVAARNPNDIRNMFTYTGQTVQNGSTVDLYSVRYFDSGNVARYVTVDNMLPQGGGLYDRVTGGVLWVALAEKAYAQANGKGYVTTSHLGVDSYSALDSGYPSWALQAITGKSASSFAINPTNIAAAWNAGKLIVLGTGATPASSYIVPGHAYAVVGYNPSSSMPFQEYNPWGTDSSGWALGRPNQIYGLFRANSTFMSKNFVSQFFGIGAIVGMDASGTGVQQVASSGFTTHPANVDRSISVLAFAPTSNQTNRSRMAAFESWSNSREMNYADTMKMDEVPSSAMELAFNSLADGILSRVA